MLEKVQTNNNKICFLDGIRGIMAVNVLICHFVCAFYPQTYFKKYADEIGGALSWFSKTPLSALVNGAIGVQSFFVLTGFLVARGVFLHEIEKTTYFSRRITRLHLVDRCKSSRCEEVTY